MVFIKPKEISPLEKMRLKNDDTFNPWCMILYNVCVMEFMHISFPTWSMQCNAMQLADLRLDFGATLELFPGWAVLNSPSFTGELSQLMKRLQDCPCPGSKLATSENIESLLILDNLTFHSSTLVQADCCYAWNGIVTPIPDNKKGLKNSWQLEFVVPQMFSKKGFSSFCESAGLSHD